MFKGITSIIKRVAYNIKGKLTLKPVIRKALQEGKTTLPEEYFYWDNLEDGFTGNKRGWYDNCLGIKASSLPLEEQVQHAYNWSAHRNPCWNMRYHPDVSLDLTQLKTEWKGSTYSHDWQPGLQWYRCTTDNKYKSTFLLLPIWKGKSIYLRFGWKVYPEFTVQNKPLPKYKERSIWAISFRIRGKV